MCATGAFPNGSVPIGGTTGAGQTAGLRWDGTTEVATATSAVDDAMEGTCEAIDIAAAMCEAIDTAVAVTATVRFVAVREAAARIKGDAMEVVAIREVGMVGVAAAGVIEMHIEEAPRLAGVIGLGLGS